MIRLLQPDLAIVEAALVGDDELADVLRFGVVPGWATFAGALEATRDALAADSDAATWGTRLFVTDDPPELVGWGGYKGPPDDGVVEIGYEIAERDWGRGLATAAASAMIAEAFADASVTTVIAHTLAEPNASNRILDKLGFRPVGEVDEGGTTVWRFVLDRPAP